MGECSLLPLTGAPWREGRGRQHLQLHPLKIYFFIWHLRPSSGGGWGHPDSLCKPLLEHWAPAKLPSLGQAPPHSFPPVPLAQLQAQQSSDILTHTVPIPMGMGTHVHRMYHNSQPGFPLFFAMASPSLSLKRAQGF